jgi:hypothetical protein
MGIRVSLRRTFLAILMSFAVASLILGSLSPVTVFLLWNLPREAGTVYLAYHANLLVHVCAIAAAGVAANLRLLGVLAHLCGDRRLARRVLLCWLGGNLFLGAQLSWILRPFFGTPGLPVQFVRPNALESNFFESLIRVISQLVR